MNSELFRLSGAVKHSPAIDEWLSGDPADLYAIARIWFRAIRTCGEAVTELLHDGCPVACVEGVPFAYVNVFKVHVNVGFFLGASLDDPKELLEGSGKRMRHVKLKPGTDIDTEALQQLIDQSYTLVKAKL